MNCPKCSGKLEIFAHEGEEIYVCPVCLAALVPEESSPKILKYFCKQELVGRLISNILDDSLFNNTKKMLSADQNFSCPKCKSQMTHYDFDKKLRFNVNRCINCGSVWINSMQIPLIAITFTENNPDDLNFKKSINSIYEITAKKKTRNIRPFEEIIAPYVIFTGLAPAIPLGDDMLTETKSFITKGIILICILTFILQILFKESLSYFGLIAERTFGHKELYRLFTYAFLHGGLFHLLGNMLFLRDL